MSKRIISLTLVFAMLCCVLGAVPFTVGAAETFTSGDFQYAVEEDGVYITGYTGTAVQLNIPTELDGKEITGIANRAFRGQTGIQAVIVPDGIQSIGDSAFEECTGIQQVLIGANVKRIGGSAFAKCSGMQTIQFSKNASLETIGEEAFRECGALRTITIPDSVTDLGGGCFWNCTALESAVIGDGVPVLLDSYWHGLFENCTALTTVEMGANVTEIRKNCFAGTAITSIEIHDKIVSIGDRAFQNCKALAGVELGDELQSIGYAAFAGCTELKTVTFGKSIDSIGERAFEESGLTEITIPSSVTKLGASCFYNCASMKTAVIGNGVTELAYAPFDGTFENCISLESVTIGSGVITIGREAFQNTALKTVVIPDNVVTISNDAFNDCDAMTNAVIGDGVVTIDGGAFANCDNLTDVTIGTGVTTIGAAAFAHTGLQSVVIPSNVTQLGGGAFLGCSALETAVIGNGVTELNMHVWDGAFDDCVSLKSVTLGSGVTKIGERAFENTAITSITIPSKVAEIGPNAFGGVKNLSEVYFAGNMPSVSKDAFNNTAADLTFYYQDGKTGFDAATKPTATYTPVKITFENTNDDVFAILPVQQITSPAGDRVVKPIDPIAMNYLFTGWYADKECTTAWDFDTVVTEDTTIYLGWVRAVDTKPVRPAGLKATGHSSRNITVSWTPVDAADSYNIYVGGELVAEDVAKAEYTIPNLESGYTYDIEVSAVNKHGESRKSLALAAKTLSVKSLMGDVDISGVVDVADIMKLKSCIMTEQWSPDELAVGDLSGNGALDVADIMGVKNIIMAS